MAGSLSKNQLTGTIPAELASLSNLMWLGLSRNQLTGTIPAELSTLSNLESLYLSNNQLTGTIPDELGNLPNLKWIYLSGNQLTGCIPDVLRNVDNNDLGELGLPFCDLLLSGLSISPRILTPAFDPYLTSYTALEGPPSVTVTASNEHGAAIRFLDEGGAEIADGDTALEGLQVDLEGGIAGIEAEVTSSDGLAVHVYTIWVRPVSACIMEGAVADATNEGLAADCEALLASRDALAGTTTLNRSADTPITERAVFVVTATLNWSADTPITEWDGVTVGGYAGACHGAGSLLQRADGHDSRRAWQPVQPDDVGPFWQQADGHNSRRARRSVQPGGVEPLCQRSDGHYPPPSLAACPTWRS